MPVKNLKKNTKNQKGGMLVCPSDLVTVTPISTVLNVFLTAVKDATTKVKKRNSWHYLVRQEK